ncbi:carbonic anhydrase [Arcticibacterium luteifluviistationis]|uniref:Carbonic anhydrase n=1 Tax=Arcticibacterium luteifluviistationis TaxID=1784714 RepID=A0A2Z4GCT5_9BACT|nr:carbonic anhydrase [Arcticibacterium luteifluviistationis]AWV98713.1 carbonic anhydrase [Arcticibacterium luteifluviistationis]
METYKKLLADNKEWANAQNIVNPVFFNKMAEGQSPEFLWIGCADSRAPADRITNTQPGQIFVHRNVANLVVHTDINMLSVLQYAVEVLKVKHVMVVGHYGCGGVKAAMSRQNIGIINKWIRHIKDVFVKNSDELAALKDEEAKFDRLCELNAIEQAKNLIKTSIIQKAWKNGNAPHVHAWILELKTGLIKELFEAQAGDTSSIEDIYKYEL